MLELGVAHGRFQFFHNDHLKYLQAAKARCRHLVIGITNPDPSLTKSDPADPERHLPARNPLTYYERFCIIRRVLQLQRWDWEEFSIVPFPINFPDLYRYYMPLTATFFLTIYDAWGERKLALFQSLGLKTEVLWRRPLAAKGLSGSDLRRRLLTGEPWQHLVPPGVAELWEEFGLRSRIQKS